MSLSPRRPIANGGDPCDPRITESEFQRGRGANCEDPCDPTASALRFHLGVHANGEDPCDRLEGLREVAERLHFHQSGPTFHTSGVPQKSSESAPGRDRPKIDTF